jgi:hypothetical protein
MAANAVQLCERHQGRQPVPATQRTNGASLARLAAFLEAKGMPTDVANMGRAAGDAGLRSPQGRA